MVEIQFVDGTKESIEAVEDTYVYDKKARVSWSLRMREETGLVFPENL